MAGELDAVAADGAGLDLDGCAQVLSYNGDGTLAYIEVVASGNTYRQSYTYTSGKLTGISVWVKQ